MSVPSHSRSSSNSTYHDALFKNTSRRWIYNEVERLKERYVKFDPIELQRVAGKAMQQDQYPSIVKFAEGGFNKVFLLKANDGREVIARIPSPIAGPPRYATASEVATLNFLRIILGLPVPKILAYSTSSNNPVGAEYIIMERVHGESLASRWLALKTEEVKDIMKQLADMEQQMFSFRFPAYGSLYHKRDIEGETQIPIEVEDFCIGPVAARQFWHGERGQMDIDRGPWLSPEDCFTSAARRETSHIMRYARPQPRRTFLLPTNHNIDPSQHTSLLSKFLEVAPLIVPPAPTHNSPALRHPDLSLSNILLEPGSSKIAGIIDWQDAVIFPLFMQAGYPAFCEHDSSRPQSLQIPKLPQNFDKMCAEEQLQAKAKLRLEEANLFYTAATGLHNDAHLNVLKIPHVGMRQYLFQQTGYPWDADVINLRAALVGITSPQVWGSISSLPCPVSFNNRERETAMKDSSEWNESERLLSTIRNHLGIDPEGGTEPDNFERACRENLKFRMEFLRQSEERERDACWQNWPFKDDSDCSSPPRFE
ncbi:kinase-like protein [Aspergillus bertholletiae]|uniref:Kinase-like protein n=1 Tax=Aspergillus bertholletiae TaxID=1226010 RepID=A0A5N7B7P0_9EURO|nr:kinase-like protein [Aspergillus bertholletiae]